eukprot:1354028-Pyramimonas_sp.AAC.1
MREQGIYLQHAHRPSQHTLNTLSTGHARHRGAHHQGADQRPQADREVTNALASPLIEFANFSLGKIAPQVQKIYVHDQDPRKPDTLRMEVDVMWKGDLDIV